MTRALLWTVALISYTPSALAAPAATASAPAAAGAVTAPAVAPRPPAPSSPAAAPAGAHYDQPPPALLDVLRAPALPFPMLAPTRDRLLLVSWVRFPPIAQVAEPYLRLAGVRVEPRTRRKHDTPGGYGVTPCAASVVIVDVATGRERPIALPPGGCVDDLSWSADGTRLAFANTTQDAVELWLGDAAAATIARVGRLRLNPMLGNAITWVAGTHRLLVKLIPDAAGPPPAAPPGSEGPGIQETDGQRGEFSTYEARDTLTCPHDEDLFTYYGTSQLAEVDADRGAVTPLGAPAVYTDLDPSPDGAHLLVQHVERPYSYAVAYNRFAHAVEVWDRRGQLERRLARLPVADRVPVRGVPTGPRAHAWRPDAAATVVWAEALDGGDWNVTVPARDRVLMQPAPFTAAPVEVARVGQRFAGITWTERRDLALLNDFDANRRWTRTFAIDVDAPARPPVKLFDRSADEHYRDPGAPALRAQPNGSWLARVDGDAIYLVGAGGTPDGDRPFLDRFDVKTLRAERLFRSERTALESFLGFAAEPGAVLTWHQSPTSPPNAWLRTLGAPIAAAAGEPARASTARPITHVADPTPVVRGIQKRLVTYKRKDGLPLSFVLMLPPGYQPGEKLPAIFYGYPLDYADAKAAGQVTGSQQRFTQLAPYQLPVLAGYAILDNTALPIVGDPKRAYDSYLPQLVDDAQAAVDTAVALGVVDRARIGVTGHSHGALMTVNLLAHTSLFRAGMATSGSYNKTFTPLGFQSERRSVWSARDVYLQVSPFFVADKITRPLLLVHGAADANPGTTPLQSQKLFEAVRGTGGTARLVMLPHEPHWYTALESNAQLVYEELRWFDRYVRGEPPAPTAPRAPATR